MEGSAGGPPPAIAEEVAVTNVPENARKKPIDRSSTSAAVADWTGDLDDMELGDDLDPVEENEDTIEVKEEVAVATNVAENTTKKPIERSSTAMAVADWTGDLDDMELGDDLDPVEENEDTIEVKE